MSATVSALTDEERYLYGYARALLLSAVDRAGDTFKWGHVRDRNEDYDGPVGTAEVSDIREHCGAWVEWSLRDDRWVINSSGGPADRDVRRALKAAEKDGHAYVIRRAGHAQIWGVTPDGDVWLREWEAEHGAVELPESPQHREWRLAREKARGELPAAREAVRDAARKLMALADSSDPKELKPFFNDRTWKLEQTLRALHAEEPEV